jgi:hypothetical protein
MQIHVMKQKSSTEKQEVKNDALILKMADYILEESKWKYMKASEWNYYNLNGTQKLIHADEFGKSVFVDTSSSSSSSSSATAEFLALTKATVVPRKKPATNSDATLQPSLSSSTFAQATVGIASSRSMRIRKAPSSFTAMTYASFGTTKTKKKKKKKNKSTASPNEIVPLLPSIHIYSGYDNSSTYKITKKTGIFEHIQKVLKRSRSCHLVPRVPVSNIIMRRTLGECLELQKLMKSLNAAIWSPSSVRVTQTLMGCGTTQMLAVAELHTETDCTLTIGMFSNLL